MLRTPGLRPFIPTWNFRDYDASFPRLDSLTALNSLRDNWWCSMGPADRDTRYLFTPRLQSSGPRVALPQQPLYSDSTAAWFPRS